MGSIPGWEDPLEEKMATHSSILAWEIPWTEEPGGLQSLGLWKSGHDSATKQQQQVSWCSSVWVYSVWDPLSFLYLDICFLL